MPITKVKISNIIHQQQIELLSYILQDVSKTYNISYDELQEKYINHFYKKKRHKRILGLQNGYTLFLKDENIDKEIKESNEGCKFGYISKCKGKMWQNLEKEKREEYYNKAKIHNNKLKLMNELNQKLGISNKNKDIEEI